MIVTYVVLLTITMLQHMLCLLEILVYHPNMLILSITKERESDSRTAYSFMCIKSTYYSNSQRFSIIFNFFDYRITSEYQNSLKLQIKNSVQNKIKIILLNFIRHLQDFSCFQKFQPHPDHQCDYETNLSCLYYCSVSNVPNLL